MSRLPSRRGFLKGLIGTAITTAVGDGVAQQALGAEPAPQEILGYNVRPGYNDPRFLQPDTEHFLLEESLGSVTESLRYPARYKNFLAEIDQAYKSKMEEMADRPIPFYDKTVFGKAAVVEHWVNTHYKYSLANHSMDSKAPVYDASGHIVAMVDIHATLDTALSPQEVVKKGGEADCLDYATAKFAALRHLGIPPEDILCIVGSLHQDAAAAAKPFNSAGDYHAWTMIRSPGSKEWVILETSGKTALLFTASAQMQDIGSIVNPDVHYKPRFYVPLLAIDGNGRTLSFDSLDKNDVPKILPAAKGRYLSIDYHDPAPASKPVATPHTAAPAP